MIHSNSSFACETVFSHPSKLDFLLRAKQLGYTTYLYFISAEEPLINIGRVQNRVKQGAHAVPEEKIITRYNRTMVNLLPALHLVDRAFIFDNSSSGEGEAYQNFAEVLNREITLLTNTVPAWFKNHVLDQV